MSAQSSHNQKTLAANRKRLHARIATSSLSSLKNLYSSIRSTLRNRPRIKGLIIETVDTDATFDDIQQQLEDHAHAFADMVDAFWVLRTKNIELREYNRALQLEIDALKSQRPIDRYTGPFLP